MPNILPKTTEACQERQATPLDAESQTADSSKIEIRTNPPLHLTIAEAAVYLCISPRKIRYLIADGRLKCARIDRRIVIRRAYLDALTSAD
jgi:excisionase family DNA binding protein